MLATIRRRATAAGTKSSPGDAARAAAHDPEQLYRAGLLLEQQEEYRKALALFEEALRLRSGEPRFQSYVGLCQVIVGKRLRTAVDLCRQAVRAESFRPELLCNLGRVEEIAGDRRAAFIAYQRGSKLDPKHPGIRAALARVGVRKSPPIRFLPRRSLLNRIAGIVLNRLGWR